MARSEYKPLLFTTTVRNPARLKPYLYILQKFEGKVLTDRLIIEIFTEAIRYGIYRPMKRPPGIAAKWPHATQGTFGEELLTDEEVALLIRTNPQNHKEAGYAKGWPSRFATTFGILRQLGLAYIKPGCAIRISPIGKRFVENINVQVNGMAISANDINPPLDNALFLNAMAKYHRDNPFLRVLNANTPLILLLKVIKRLNNDPNTSNCGISRKEIPLLIFWKDDDDEAAYQMIMEIRNAFGFNPSDETIYHYCVDRIMGGSFKKFQLESIVNEYPDEYIRKMRYTGVISLRGGGRFIDINQNEIAKVEYLLEEYSDYHSFTDEDSYYEYVSTIDDRLLDVPDRVLTSTAAAESLSKWVREYDWDKVKNELMILSKHHLSSDPVLKFLDAPLRLEFLAAIAMKCRRPEYTVKPNYTCDDEGLPTSTAGGNQADIECYGSNNVIVEVTMSEGRSQVVMEGWPVKRHLEDFSKKNSSASCAFVAPTIYADTKDQFDWTYERKSLYVAPYEIPGFIAELEKNERTIAIPV